MALELKKLSFLDYAMLFGLAVVWGLSFVLTKFSVQELSPIALAMLRTLGGAVILLVIGLLAARALPKEGWEWRLLLLSAAFGNALPFVLIGWGLEKVDAGLSAVLMGVMPLLTFLLAHFTLKDEKINTQKLMGVAIGLIGLIVLVGPNVLYDLGNQGIRELALLAAACCYSCNVIVTRKLSHLDPIMYSGLTFALVALALGPFSMSSLAQDAAQISNDVWLYVALLILFPTTLASIVLFMLIRRAGAGFFAQVNYLVPISGVFWGWAVASEKIELTLALALLLILSGIALANYKGQTNTKTPKLKKSHAK